MSEEIKKRELFFRLMRKKPDGTYGVVGYEKHESGNMYHSQTINNASKLQDFFAWRDVFEISEFSNGDRRHDNRIQYDRKDEYAGFEVNGEKVFENDKVLVDGHYLGNFKATVLYEPYRFYLKHKKGKCDNLEYIIKIIGIEGVVKC